VLRKLRRRQRGEIYMSIKITRVLTEPERQQMDKDAIEKGWYSNDRRVFLPGMAWHQPWYYAPEGWPDQLPYRMFKQKPADFSADGHLSEHYWRDWADKRPPICVVCPNGEQWEIDRKSSNGSGWVVTGDLPNITCSPSIVVNGYHGFLANGLFTADLEGRGPNGIARPVAA